MSWAKLSNIQRRNRYSSHRFHSHSSKNGRFHIHSTICAGYWSSNCQQLALKNCIQFMNFKETIKFVIYKISEIPPSPTIIHLTMTLLNMFDIYLWLCIIFVLYFRKQYPEFWAFSHKPKQYKHPTSVEYFYVACLNIVIIRTFIRLPPISPQFIF